MSAGQHTDTKDVLVEVFQTDMGTLIRIWPKKGKAMNSLNYLNGESVQIVVGDDDGK